MERQDLYNRTVDILVQAYFQDTLRHGTPCGCAIGNLVAAAMNYKIGKDFEGDLIWEKEGRGCFFPSWSEVHCITGTINIGKFNGAAKEEIESTGYSPMETALIEYAFENSVSELEDMTNDEYMFRSLLAVIDCLDKIHKNNDSSISESQKKRFNKPERVVQN